MNDKPPTVRSRDYGSARNQRVAELVASDAHLHRPRPDDLAAFAKWHRQRALEEAAVECDGAAREAYTVGEDSQARHYQEIARRIRARASGRLVIRIRGIKRVQPATRRANQNGGQ